MFIWQSKEQRSIKAWVPSLKSFEGKGIWLEEQTLESGY